MGNMNHIIIYALLCAHVIAFDGNVMLFGTSTPDATEAYSLDLSSASFDKGTETGCYAVWGPLATAKAKGEAILVCGNSIVTVKSNNKKTAAKKYTMQNTQCPFDSVLYDTETGRLWGSYTQLVAKNATYGAQVGHVVSVDLSHSNPSLTEHLTFVWNHEIVESGHLTNNTCTILTNDVGAWIAPSARQLFFFRSSNLATVSIAHIDEVSLVEKVAVSSYNEAVPYALAMDLSSSSPFSPSLYFQNGTYVFQYDLPTQQKQIVAPASSAAALAPAVFHPATKQYIVFSPSTVGGAAQMTTYDTTSWSSKPQTKTIHGLPDNWSIRIATVIDDVPAGDDNHETRTLLIVLGVSVIAIVVICTVVGMVIIPRSQRRPYLQI